MQKLLDLIQNCNITGNFFIHKNMINESKREAPLKTIILHGLGQTAKDWDEVIRRTTLTDVDCLDLFDLLQGRPTYQQLQAELEKRYANMTGPFRICGLSLGAILALEYAIRHRDKVESLILIGVQYRSPALLLGVQNLIFHCMPQRLFLDIGITKEDMICLTNSMRGLNLTAKLAKVDCPVTILCGEKDRANLKAAKNLVRLLPQAELQIVKGAGHEVNKDAPEAIAAILDRRRPGGNP